MSHPPHFCNRCDSCHLGKMTKMTESDEDFAEEHSATRNVETSDARVAQSDSVGASRQEYSDEEFASEVPMSRGEATSLVPNSGKLASPLVKPTRRRTRRTKRSSEKEEQDSATNDGHCDSANPVQRRRPSNGLLQHQRRRGRRPKGSSSGESSNVTQETEFGEAILSINPSTARQPENDPNDDDDRSDDDEEAPSTPGAHAVTYNRRRNEGGSASGATPSSGPSAAPHRNSRPTNPALLTAELVDEAETSRPPSFVLTAQPLKERRTKLLIGVSVLALVVAVVAVVVALTQTSSNSSNGGDTTTTTAQPTNTPSVSPTKTASSLPTATVSFHPTGLPTPRPTSLAPSLYPTSINARWVQRGPYLMDDSSTGFGRSVAISGGLVAIGSPQTRGPDGFNQGLVRVMRFNRDTNWTQVGNDLLGESASDRFGSALALSGNTLVVGARQNRANNRPNAGQVRVYTLKNSTAWVPKGSSIDGVLGNEQSGTSVAMSQDGNTVAIGSPLLERARVFRFNGTDWTQIGPDFIGQRLSFLGTQVDLSDDGTVLAISMPQHDSLTDQNVGRVQVYQLVTTNQQSLFQPMGPALDGTLDSDLFGSSIALSGSGTRLAVGMPRFRFRTGLVRVFDYNGTAWTPIGQSLQGDFVSTSHGFSVALNTDGTTLAVGAPEDNGDDDDNTNEGTVRTYVFENGYWRRLGMDVDGPGFGDRFGDVMDLSDDGTTMVASSDYSPSFDAAYVGIFDLM